MNSLPNKQKLSCETLEAISTQAPLVQGVPSNAASQDIFVSLKLAGRHELSVRHSKITFNDDHKPYTPTFVQLNQKNGFEQQEKIFKQIYVEKIRESQRSKCQLMLPKPTSDYCMICRESFPDYLKHISHPVHVARVSKQPCNDLIDNIIQTVHRSAKQTLSRCASSDFQVAPRKKRKIQNAQESVYPQLMRKVSKRDSLLQQIKMEIA